MHVDLRYRHALRRRVDDVNRSMVCYLLSPRQLEVSESRYFTGTFDHLSGAWLTVNYAVCCKVSSLKFHESQWVNAKRNVKLSKALFTST